MPFLKIKNVFSLVLNIPEEVVLCKWCLWMGVKLAIKCFQCNVFIFINKRWTGYDINIAK